jgi:hypothetical protein
MIHELCSLTTLFTLDQLKKRQKRVNKNQDRNVRELPKTVTVCQKLTLSNLARAIFFANSFLLANQTI